MIRQFNLILKLNDPHYDPHFVVINLKSDIFVEFQKLYDSLNRSNNSKQIQTQLPYNLHQIYYQIQTNRINKFYFLKVSVHVSLTTVWSARRKCAFMLFFLIHLTHFVYVYNWSQRTYLNDHRRSIRYDRYTH